MSASSSGTILLDPASITLGIGSAGGGIGLTWPVILSNFATLYTTSNLMVPSAWAPAPGTPFLSNQELNLALPATNTASFYRLQLN
jgi:hypothetical protein